MAVTRTFGRNSGHDTPVRAHTQATPRFAERWEYQEMRLPLELGTMRSWLGQERLFRRVARRADAIIEDHVQGLSKDGWQPDEATSFVSLYKRDRVGTTYRGGLVPGHSFHEVRIRFKRSSRAD